MQRSLGTYGKCVVVALVAGGLFGQGEAFGQAGLRDALEKLDRNGDGLIERDEITPLARPYLERIAKARRISLEQANRIDRLQEAARIYYALQNGVSGRDVRPEPKGSVLTFGPEKEEPLVPEFGLARVKFQYTQADLDEADRTMRRCDRNDDGYIDRREAARAPWTHRNPFDDDLNKDDRLTRLELTQRYARRRLLDNAADELVRKSRRVGNGIRRSTEEEKERKDQSQWWRRGGSDFWLTATLMGRFDANRNGRLEKEEAEGLNLPAVQVDADRDGEISRDELFNYVKERQTEASGGVEGLPGWFYELDGNRDGQVAMEEFATEWSEAKIREFTSLDVNGDGLLTVSEVTDSKAMVGGSYRNDEAVVLAPRKTIISEIEVNEDYKIGDLNVQLSITHSHVSYLDAYLTGPDGQRIELFTAIGGSSDNFDDTIFDDQSREPITRAKPPFQGKYLPEGLLNRQPGLSHFNGKSVKGVWQLVIRGTRNERFGMLHHWGLFVRPIEDMLDAPPLEEDAETSETAVEPGQVGESRPAERSEPAQSAAVLEKPSPEQVARYKEWVEKRKAEWKAKMEQKQLSSEEKARGKAKLEQKQPPSEEKARAKAEKRGG